MKELNELLTEVVIAVKSAEYDCMSDEIYIETLDNLSAIREHIKEQDAVIYYFRQASENLIKSYHNQDMIVIKGMVSLQQALNKSKRRKKAEATE